MCVCVEGGASLAEEGVAAPPPMRATMLVA